MILAIVLLVVGQSASTDLDSKISSVLPNVAEDRWLQIPWRTDLSVALKDAEREKKPLYMWVMDGNPLGCT